MYLHFKMVIINYISMKKFAKKKELKAKKTTSGYLGTRRAYFYSSFNTIMFFCNQVQVII